MRQFVKFEDVISIAPWDKSEDKLLDVTFNVAKSSNEPATNGRHECCTKIELAYQNVKEHVEGATTALWSPYGFYFTTFTGGEIPKIEKY